MLRSKISDAGIGIILCDCDGELYNHLNLKQLEKMLHESDNLLTFKMCSGLCREAECLKTIQSVIDHGTKRMVIGGCSHERFEHVLTDLLRETKHYDCMWWPVNIYEQCVLVHRNKRSAARKAANRLIAGVERVKRAQPVESKKKQVRQNVIVIGGGIAGLQTALSLEKLGHQVSVVDRSHELGGAAAELPELYGYLGYDAGSDESIARFVEELVDSIKKKKNIRIFSNALCTSVIGEPGNFTLIVRVDGTEMVLQAGAVVLAPGAHCESILESMDAAGSTRIVDISGFLAMVRNGNVPHRIAFVMDMLTEQDRMVSAQVFSAAELASKQYHAVVKLYCNNVRVAATGMELLYRRARNAGVVVVKSGAKPVISSSDKEVSIIIEDPIIGAKVADTYDLAIIADIQARGDKDTMPGAVKGLKTGPGDALQYDNVWLLPVQTNRPGIFVVGAARGNSEYREALIDGMAVAGEINSIIGTKQIEVREDAAAVDKDKCVLCLTCLRICPHSAVSINEAQNAVSISPVTCQRCGICAAECPAQAIRLPGFTDEEITADIGQKPRVTVFACENSAVPAAEKAGTDGYAYGTEIEIIRIPCVGRIDLKAILTPLEKGAEKVMVLGCYRENCKYLTGSSRAARRINRLAAILKKSDIDVSRVVFGSIAAMESGRFYEYVTGKIPEESAHKEAPQ